MGFPNKGLPAVGGGMLVPDQKGLGASQSNQPKMVSLLQDFSVFTMTLCIVTLPERELACRHHP